MPEVLERVGLPLGHVRLVAEDRQGRELWASEEKNLVVNAARQALANLLSGLGSGQTVTQGGFGTNGTAPAGTDAALTSAVLVAATATSPSTGVAQFAFTLDYAQGNGMTVRELGLLTAGGALFSRRAPYAIEKSSDFRLRVTWRIVF